MQSHTAQAGFPAEFRAPVGTFRLSYSDTALEVARTIGLDMTYLPLDLDTRRAELVEIMRMAMSQNGCTIRYAWGAAR
jgi:hypothetical protein